MTNFDFTDIGIEVEEDQVDSIDGLMSSPFKMDGELYTGKIHEKNKKYLFYYQFVEGKLHSTFKRPSYVCINRKTKNIDYIHWFCHGIQLKSVNTKTNVIEYVNEPEWTKFVLSSIENEI